MFEFGYQSLTAWPVLLSRYTPALQFGKSFILRITTAGYKCLKLMMKIPPLDVPLTGTVIRHIVETEASRNIVIQSQYVLLKRGDDQFHYKVHRHCSSSQRDHANTNFQLSSNYYCRLLRAPLKCMKGMTAVVC